MNQHYMIFLNYIYEAPVNICMTYVGEFFKLKFFFFKKINISHMDFIF